MVFTVIIKKTVKKLHENSLFSDILKTSTEIRCWEMFPDSLYPFHPWRTAEMAETWPIYHHGIRICAHCSWGVRSPGVFLTTDSRVAALFPFNWSSSGMILARTGYLLAACLRLLPDEKPVTMTTLCIRRCGCCDISALTSTTLLLGKYSLKFWVIIKISVALLGCSKGESWGQESNSECLGLHLLPQLLCTALSLTVVSSSNKTANEPCTQQHRAFHSTLYFVVG